ncbi:hypothetical protein N836_27530 [Leptolyngbya sp. Heron Island J]|uniref:hypothetical protein n=1 Tax=Leptolyngbya sp. Heron Island J TaxID=1385935 RepID=UPI0003B94881|nr:hypothetical protein [Leptolyngbya sp. Heron Island J]ESA32345.1 hypothetical protein N836_27530 [Leptolyngbya sp. Heron Island J]
MLVTSESLKQDIEKLTDDQLQRVAEFIAFLRFQEKRRRIELNPALLAPLTNEFAQEDRALAESGMDDYGDMLAQEDQ